MINIIMKDEYFIKIECLNVEIEQNMLPSFLSVNVCYYIYFLIYRYFQIARKQLVDYRCMER